MTLSDQTTAIRNAMILSGMEAHPAVNAGRASLCPSTGIFRKEKNFRPERWARFSAAWRSRCTRLPYENWLEVMRYLNMDHLREHKKQMLRQAA